ncbi:M48 family metallopeptidase [Marinobacter fonticola]|uniref:M48 family metallopeptidase n=1 Tax=Marinobacter fonticola TaxID=2603215 RepID=UPI0011E67BB6|nr:M48 family metallopeptidase [Marinobacter fonticola]
MQLQGDFYTGAASRRREARLVLAGERLCLQCDGKDRVLGWSEITVSPRVGNTPRYLYLPGGGVFETADNDSVDAFVQAFDPGLMAGFVHRLENHLGLILIGTVFTVLVTLFVFFYGVPWTSKVVADLIPQSVRAEVSASTLESMDGRWLSPTALPQEVQARVRNHFAPMLGLYPDLSLKVEFRSSEYIDANAMALPDGTIIFTDEMVTLAENDDQLLAVLAHEIGHVAHNHGMTGVVQSSLVFWLAVVMTGDLSAFADTTVGAPAVLMTLAYSRDMEREADTYALELMQAEDLAPIHFVNLMRRLEASHDGPNEEAESKGEGRKGEGRKERGAKIGDEGDWLSGLRSLMSSHPMTEERIERFENAAR